MKNRAEIFDFAAQLSSSYGRLESAFSKFVEGVRAAAQDQSFFVQGLSVLDSSSTSLDVAFAGRRYKIFFASVRGEDGYLKGELQCFAVQSVPDEKFVEIGRLHFKGNAETVDPFPGEGVPLEISYPADAALIVLTFVTKDWSR